MINFFICKISNDLSDREKLDKILVIRKNQTTDEITTYSEIPNNWSVSVSLVGRTGAVIC